MVRIVEHLFSDVPGHAVVIIFVLSVFLTGFHAVQGNISIPGVHYVEITVVIRKSNHVQHAHVIY